MKVSDAQSPTHHDLTLTDGSKITVESSENLDHCPESRAGCRPALDVG